MHKWRAERFTEYAAEELRRMLWLVRESKES
jgi:hypothetical protein